MTGWVAYKVAVIPSEARDLSSTLLLACRRVPQRRGHGLAEIPEHEVERDADALALAVVGRHGMLQPRREDQQPAFLALRIGAVGGEPGVLARLGHDHRGLSARILEDDLRAGG